MTKLKGGVLIEARYLDCQKSFVSISHRLLVSRLRSLNLATSVKRWIVEYVRERRFNVWTDWALSYLASADSESTKFRCRHSVQRRSNGGNQASTIVIR